MASTNKTTNYELSQYVGTDKPTYLGDYNGDMLKIDTAIHGVATSVGTETGRINILESSVGNVANLTTTDKSSLVNAVNEVDSNSKTNSTNIGTLSNLETINKSTIVNAINEIVGKFNINNFKNNLTFTITTVSGQAPTQNATYTRLSSAHNDDGSIGKIYGCLEINGGGSAQTLSTINIKSSDTGLRPTQDITLDGCCFQAITGNDGYVRTRTQSYTLKTNGTIEINGIQIWGGSETRIFNFIACLIFATDFGDVPAPSN